MKLNWKSEQTRFRFHEALSSLLASPPPIYMIEEWLDTDETILQEWCIKYARVHWMTGISIIEATQMLVEEAFGNANIDEEGNVK
jgi:hypothetical protein